MTPPGKAPQSRRTAAADPPADTGPRRTATAGNGGTPAPHGMAAVDPVAVVALSIRRERTRTGLSLTELAKRAGIAKSTLSQLESGTGNPSIETLWALAVALGVPFSRLVDPPRPDVLVVRVGEGTATYSEQANYAVTLLASSAPGTRQDIYRIVAQPGERHTSAPHMPGTTEHVVISSGRALLGPTGAPVELGPGDYAVYPGDAPHAFEALEPDTVAVLISEYL
ncbi:Helix-turn-helix [Sinosporangium album]|uniref:Helix-turn-helix n=1 Tax=Sinosporangium album TaxID=504805 RepID=A0A1G7WU85_9ACTN|nr:helix-turn-helix domain-containing protein [Sinosporangium album]SDG75478.1 Helix-turn-helix [Sinosporangium album]